VRFGARVLRPRNPGGVRRFFPPFFFSLIFVWLHAEMPSRLDARDVALGRCQRRRVLRLGHGELREHLARLRGVVDVGDAPFRGNPCLGRARDSVVICLRRNPRFPLGDT